MKKEQPECNDGEHYIWRDNLGDVFDRRPMIVKQKDYWKNKKVYEKSKLEKEYGDYSI